MRISNNYKAMSDVYKIFCNGNFDLSDKALEQMYEYETFGRGDLGKDIFEGKHNGYAVGKKWMDVQIAMWFGWVMEYGWFGILKDLYLDLKFPVWWLDKVFGKFIDEREELYSGFDFKVPFMPKRCIKIFKYLRQRKERTSNGIRQEVRQD